MGVRRRLLLPMVMRAAPLIFFPFPPRPAGAEAPPVWAAPPASRGKAIAAGIAIGLAAAGGAVGMGMAVAKSVDGISRQPEAEGKIRTTLMLGLVFVETAIIYALIVAILIVFVI